MSETNLKTKAAKGFFWGGLSSGLQQVICAVVGCFLLNRLTGEDYGLVGMLAIFIGIANTIQEGGFKAALINRKEFSERDHNAVFWFTVMVSATLYIILFCLAGPISRFYGEPELVKLSRILFLSFFFNSLSISSNAVLTRRFLIKQKSMMELISVAAGGVAAVLFILEGYGYWALVANTLVKSVVDALLKLTLTPWKPGFNISFAPIKEMFRFGFGLMLASIATQLQSNIFSVVVGKYHTKQEVGYYYQGNKWAAMANQIFNGMTAGVAQPLLISAGRDSAYKVKIFRKMCRMMAFIACPAMLGLAFIAPEFFTLLNPEFMPAVVILQIYCIYQLGVCVQGICGQAAIAGGRSDLYLIFTVVNAVLQIATAFLTHSRGINFMAGSLAVVSFAGVVIWYMMLKLVLDIKLIYLFKDFVPYFVLSLLVMVATHFIVSPIGNTLLLMVAKIAVAVVLYVILMKLSDSKMYRDAIKFVKERKLD